MWERKSSGRDFLIALLRVSACVVSVVMLLLFPSAKPHSFATHFRAPEFRRAVERETPIAHSDENPQPRIALNESLPAFPFLIETASKLVAVEHFESPAKVSVPRLLNRLKLNPSGSSGQVPLLAA